MLSFSLSQTSQAVVGFEGNINHFLITLFALKKKKEQTNTERKTLQLFLFTPGQIFLYTAYTLLLLLFTAVCCAKCLDSVLIFNGYLLGWRRALPSRFSFHSFFKEGTPTLHFIEGEGQLNSLFLHNAFLISHTEFWEAP